jgi:hypothetical protein
MLRRQVRSARHHSDAVRLLATAPNAAIVATVATVALRNAWYDAPDLAARKRLAEQIQLRFLETPFLPVGQHVQATAHRAEVADIG